MNNTKIQWHPGFVAAMNLEFEENRSDLIYEKEYNLNTKPLEIDLLVIKKNPNIEIVNEIGKIFRGHNIIEYKSPGDQVDIDTFYKAGAYGCLYKASGESVDERSAEDITISLIRDTKPEGLFHYFEQHEIKTENPYPGIYYVRGAVLFPTQIIVGKELKQEGHAWIKALSNKLQKQEMRELLEKISGLSQKFDKELADSVLEVSIRANKEIMEELRGDESMCEALLEIMRPEVEVITREITKEIARESEKKGKAEGRIEGRAEGRAAEIVETGYEFGLSEDNILERLQKKLDISFEAAQEYLEKYGKMTAQA